MKDFCAERSTKRKQRYATLQASIYKKIADGLFF